MNVQDNVSQLVDGVAHKDEKVDVVDDLEVSHPVLSIHDHDDLP